MTEEAMNESAGEPEKKKERKRKGPAKADAASLERAAYWYLERFATSRENLRRVLMRRVEKSAIAYRTDRQAGAETVAALIGKLSEQGLLDDAAYAEARVRTLRDQGKAARAIRWSLAQKGVAAEIIGQAIEAIDAENETEGGDADFRAAVRYAKRRRLGPFRDPGKARGKEAREENARKQKQKDLAALARAGFSYGLAEKVVCAETAAELEADG